MTTKCLPLLCACLVINGLQASPQRPPNLIVILADDLGWGELGAFGQKVIRTPRLDRMASEGRRFTQFYAGATVCGPSRSVLMTGLHQGHTRVRGNSTNPASMTLRPEDITVAEVLKDAGYRTAIFGKWGLGDVGAAEAGLPRRQGFDTFFGYLNHYHAHNHFPDYLWRNEERVPLPNRVHAVGDSGGGVADDPVLFADDLVTDEVLKWVSRNQSAPFFIYWNPVLPHANNERTSELGNGAEVPDLGPYTLTDWPEQDKGQAAMITRLDGYVGRLLDQLQELGLAENTLVIFTSDNGPHNESRHNLARFTPAGPFSGIKRDLTEGGIRVPTIAWWPGRVSASTATGHVAHFADWLATAAELAGAQPPTGLDSLSFVPALLGQPNQATHDFLYWEFNERGFRQAALWQGRWKAIRTTHPVSGFQLYDLANDPAEQKDLTAAHPEIVARFQEYFKTARSDTPNWPASPRVEAVSPNP